MTGRGGHAIAHDRRPGGPRFSQYAEHPARASLMSRTCNVATYYQEVLRYLRIDAKALDSGYCERLRREAWSAAGPGRSSGSQTEAIMHLLLQRAQEELATIAMAIDASTLDVERKHNLDRRSEARRVASVAKSLARWNREVLAHGVARRLPNWKGLQ